ncbi:uncharacterized protein LOC124665582 [Lolium rigidum]|uniref:uncharacterized protein LOC124665582 n=1 Tax=Lolium rigidum TaxID=89674 RepID=UPI001F5D37D4|nr:uncharacterized protein LOC124665582 [Lolium rigidum]
MAEVEIQATSRALADISIHSNDGEGETRPGRPIRGVATGKVVAKTRPLRLKGINRVPPDENQPPPPARDGAEDRENRRPLSILDEAAAAEQLKEENALIRYRRCWERSWAPSFGSFEDETSIGPMRYTSGPIPANAFPEETLQIFSIRVRAPTDGLKWPLHVHGYVATRDTADHNRNYLFRRTRDNCQTVTQKDPFLQLTGPSRGIVYLDPITFEIELKVKGQGESEDEMLAFSVFYYGDGFHCERRISICNPHKRCTLEYSVALRQHSVEATISIKVVDGSWPDNHRGQVVCLTSGVKGKIVLLGSGDGELPICSNGMIELSRRVVSVELGEKLMVAVDASLSSFLARGTAAFKPENSGTSHGMIDLGTCKMQVTVAWSRFVII